MVIVMRPYFLLLNIVTRVYYCTEITIHNCGNKKIFKNVVYKYTLNVQEIFVQNFVM